jgi:hypothetical protein
VKQPLLTAEARRALIACSLIANALRRIQELHRG